MLTPYETEFTALFGGLLRHDALEETRITVTDQNNRSLLAESSLLGSMTSLDFFGEPVYVNVSEPFALVAVGVQGSGKSHTTAVVIENCLLPVSERKTNDFDQRTKLNPPDFLTTEPTFVI